MQFVLKYTRVIRRQSKWFLSNSSRKGGGFKTFCWKSREILSWRMNRPAIKSLCQAGVILAKTRKQSMKWLHRIVFREHEKAQKPSMLNVNIWEHLCKASPWHSVWKLHTRADVDFHKVSCGFAGSHHPDLRKINVLYGPAKKKKKKRT